MKRYIWIIAIMILSFTLTACDNNTAVECKKNEELVGKDCVEKEIVEPAKVDINNLFNLNVGNTDGWELFTNYKSIDEMSIINGVFAFTQANTTENEDSTWDRKFLYNTLNINGSMDYTLSFSVTGTVGEIITIYIQLDIPDSIYQQEFILDGTNQTFTMSIDSPATVANSGVFAIGVGTFENGSSVTISNIVIEEKERVDDGMNILFIGNSFTFYNDMPNMVLQMGLTNGFTVHVEDITYGGFSLNRYVTAGSEETQQVIDTLNERDWDYVIIQEHSSKPDTNKREFLNSVNLLNNLIKDHGAQTILYSTWSYRDGSDKLASTGYTYDEFYHSLTNAYIEASTTYNILRAPVGTIFYNLTKEQTAINLLNNSDDFHPNVSGSYIAAYTFYSMIFGDNNNQYLPSGLSTDTAEILRTYVLNCLNSKE